MDADMDVLCLFPNNSISQEALALPRNQHAVNARGTVPSSSIEVKVPLRTVNEKQKWQFSFSSREYSNSDVYLPLPAGYGAFTVTLHFARPKGDHNDHAAFMMHVEAENPSVFFVRVVFALKVNGKEVEHQKCVSAGNYHLRDPLFLDFGPHAFQVGKAPSNDNNAPAVLRWRQLQVKHELGTVKVEDDEWEVVRHLGKGGFGSVDLVLGMLSGVFRAMKTVTIRLGRETLEKKALAEGTTLEAFDDNVGDHHIIKYYGRTELQHGGYKTIRMYFQACHGDIDSLIRREIAIAHFPSIVKHIGASLMHMHLEKDIMHRDIKPANMLYRIPYLDEDAAYEGEEMERALGVFGPNSLQFFVGDFGAARQHGGDDWKSWCGTPNYVAPEVTIGGGQVYGKPADICSFGITLLEILDWRSTVGVYMETVGASGWKIEEHQENPYWFHEYVRGLQHMEAPTRVQPFIWSFLKTMVAFNPADRSTIDVVMDVLSGVEVTNTSGGSIYDALRKVGDKVQAGSKLRVEIPAKGQRK